MSHVKGKASLLVVCVILLTCWCWWRLSVRPGEAFAHEGADRHVESQQHGGYLSAKHPLILAHRGSRVLTAENTLEAFRVAASLGAHVLETDVWLTKDGHLVLFHDRTLGRTTNAIPPTLRIRDLTLEQVKQLDAAYHYSPDGGRTFPLRDRNITIPTLAEFLDEFPTHMINIEMKGDDLRVAEVLVRELEERRSQGKQRIEDRLVIGGVHCGVAQRFRGLAKELDLNVGTFACEGECLALYVLTLLRSTWIMKNDTKAGLPTTTGGAAATLSKAVSSMVKGILRRAAGLLLPHFRQQDFDAYVAPIQHGPIRLGTTRTVRNAHTLGRKVIFWMVNDEAEMRRVLSETRCDGIVTDRPDLAVKVFKEIGIYEAPPLAATMLPPPPYFDPVDSPFDTHTCVTTGCRFVYLVAQRLVLILALGPVTMVVLALVLYRCTKRGFRITTSRKQKLH